MEKENSTSINSGAVLSVQKDTPSRLTDYYFDVIKGHSISINNQITDYYLENNSAVQDHIAHAPITITLSGLSGEVVYTPALPEYYNKEVVKTISYIKNKFNDNKLTTLEALIPKTSNTTQQAKNIYNYIEASANRYMGILQHFKEGDTFKETRLQEIHRKLLLLRNNNTALWVHTPYGDYLNMYIQSIILRQNEENFVTDIEMTLKQLNFVDVKYTEVDKTVMSQYNAYAQAKEQDNGKADTKATLAKSALNSMGITKVGSGIRNK